MHHEEHWEHEVNSSCLIYQSRGFISCRVKEWAKNRSISIAPISAGLHLPWHTIILLDPVNISILCTVAVSVWNVFYRGPDPVISSVEQVSYLLAWAVPLNSSIALKISDLILTIQDYTTDELDYWTFDVVYITLGGIGPPYSNQRRVWWARYNLSELRWPNSRKANTSFAEKLAPALPFIQP